MIDLSRNRGILLTEIGALEPAAEPLSDITDSRVGAADVRVRIYGHGKKDLFGLLKVALSDRFAAVSRPQLIRDLLVPLRNALGNAFKHGNARNPARPVCVEIVLTRKGALIMVTDGGSGFDAELTFRRFLEQKRYCEHRGAGFRNLHQAKSTVSYENGGRTLLLCFLPTIPAPCDDSPAACVFSALARVSSPSPPPKGGEGWGEEGQPPIAASPPSPMIIAALNRYPAAGWLQTCLPAGLPPLSEDQARIESYRVYATRGPADDGCGDRYVLRIAHDDGRPAETAVLTGRRHATEAAARGDFAAAKCLYDAAIPSRLLIPKPVGWFPGEPCVVLYHFDPWMNLWEYLSYRRSLKSLCRAAEWTGQALASLHRSRVVFRDRDTTAELSGQRSAVRTPDELGGEEFSAMVAAAEKNLEALGGGSALVNDYCVFAQRIEEWAAGRRHRVVAPIHGALGWDCLQFGVDGRFYLYGFEGCRQSDPGLDLGGFGADLLCYALAGRDEEAHRASFDALLSSYNAAAEHPMGENDLRFYTAVALVQRLGRAETRVNAHARQWLGAWDVAWGQGEAAAASALSS